MRIPPTAVGGLLRSSLQKRGPRLNPPNGSWGIVKVQPQSPIAVWRRLGFNDPPTAVGGIQEKFVCRCRLCFNDPPPAVGGICRIVQPYPGTLVPRVSKRLADETAAQPFTRGTGASLLELRFPPKRPRNVGDHEGQLDRVNGLGDVEPEPRAQRAQPYFIPSERRQRDRRYPL